jgi:NTP pyrophosphatase (non-canonical NTP hydrolase)
MRLDDLYKMTAFIYQDANLSRSKEATFLHFVEVCGMLTQQDRKKKRVKVDVASAICKALGWYFPLLAKMGVASIEELLFLKYPDACPYCRQKPHIEADCKLVRGAEKTVSHAEVLALVEGNRERMPSNLNEWRLMFRGIYPRNLNSQPGFSSVALFEELGELAEAIRVFDRYPHYFYGEAADVFSYIMGIANEYVLNLDDEESFDLDAEYLSRYPGLCINCGSRTCMCPSIPAATVGRMAKEMRIDISERRILDYDTFSADGEAVAKGVFEGAGFDPQIARRLPFDRGDLNVALTQLSYRLANALEAANHQLAEQLRKQALGIGRAERGTASREEGASQIMALLREAWGELDTGLKQEIRDEGGASGDIAHLFEKRVLVVTANPDREPKHALRIDREIRAIREAFRPSNSGVHIEPLMAATIDDLRRALSRQHFDIVHFAGHADADGISLVNEVGAEVDLSYDALAQMIRRQKTIQCVVLNACHTMTGIVDPFAPLVIGMMDEIDDEAAIAFATGFYDAIAAQRSADDAYDEGVLSVRSKGFDSTLIVKMRQKR